jgi:signal transduction histidine kinase
MSRRRSLAARLVWSGLALTAVAIVVAGVAIGFGLHHFVVGQIDRGLDERIASVASSLRPAQDGGVAVGPRVEAPPYDRFGSGWYWEVRDADGTVVARSTSLGDGAISVDAPRFRWEAFWDFGPRPADGKGPRGETLHLRMTSTTVGSAPVTIVASAPDRAIFGPMRDALAPLAICMALLAVALALASMLQVRFGLRPLRALRGEVAAVRTGQAASIAGEQPAELRPLVEELNTLLEQNRAGLERARRHVANLAHGLKTPLATLSLSAGRQGGEDGRSMQAQVASMERQIRHHLGRARAAALGEPARMTTPVAARVGDHAAMFAKVHAERAIAFSSSVEPTIAVACEPQDLDEILGNLLDNAFKWARATIIVEARRAERMVVLTVDDDGPGLKDDQIPDALLPGRRLDETIPGDGFGLSIVRELVELYAGSLSLSRSPLGGLRATVALPAA